MKLLTTISKNLKLLFRNKESAYTIIIGPLLIILLVSFAFMGSSDQYTIRVGTYAPATTSLSERTINTLNGKGYIVSVYPNQNDCIESVKNSASHACIVFSDKEAGNETVPVTFYLDMSRTNIIYQIADDLSGALDLQADLIRKQLTGDALLRMHTASILVERDYNLTQRISTRLGNASEQLSLARDALSQLSNATANISSLQMLKGDQNGLAQNTNTVVNFSTAALDEATQILWQLDGACTSCDDATHAKVRTIQQDISNAETKITLISQDTQKQQLFEANLLLDDTMRDLANLQDALENDTAAKLVINSTVTKSSADVETSARDIKRVVASLGYTKDFLNGETANETTISTPIQTSIVSITATSDRLSFTYPYLLVLVIMFIGMLLASMLVVADKTSRAAFRNFTTPTSDGYHIVVSFITAFVLLVIEVAIILLLSSFFIARPLLLNTVSTISLITIAIILFTFIGMIIGYLSKTQEAAMIASISVGSILLFISNLIIPVEGMAFIVQYISVFNPYLVLSELLKKSMLYGVSFNLIYRQVVVLLALSVVLLLITLFIQSKLRKRYFRQDGGLLAAHIPIPLSVGQMQVHNEAELLDALDHMTRAEFDKVVTSEENIIARWVEKELRNKGLAKRLRTTSKERMILRLDEYLEKHGKSIKRE